MKVVIYLTRVGLALSVLFNVLLGGPTNQTFSARNWAWKRENRWHIVPVIDGMFVITTYVIQKLLTPFGINVSVKNVENHCMESWVWWHTHAQMHACENLIDRMEIDHGKEKGREVQRIHFSG